MSVITPKDLAGRNFSVSFRGYNKEEVDAYINKVITTTPCSTVAVPNLKSR